MTVEQIEYCWSKRNVLVGTLVHKEKVQPADAEDIVHDVIISMYDKDINNLPAYLWQAVFSQRVHRYVDEKRRHEILLKQFPIVISNTSMDSGASVCKQLAMDFVISQLDQEQFNFVLDIIETPGPKYPRLTLVKHRAMKRLKRLLQKRLQQKILRPTFSANVPERV